jgi:hypothetical protein
LNLCRDHVLEAKHKIFLSHSGAQKSFVADLCADLMGRDRYPFFDRLRSSLPIGDKFPNLIFGAIKQCKVGIVVISEEFFTRSKWPMLELVAMVEESKKLNGRMQIIPVFYSISRDRCCDPIVQAKWMKRYWKKWQKKDRRMDVGKWESALGVFGSTTSLIMKKGMLDGELRAEIVKAVCQKVLPETRWDDSGVKGKTRLCQVRNSKCSRNLCVLVNAIIHLSTCLIYCSVKEIHALETKHFIEYWTYNCRYLKLTIVVTNFKL